MNTCTLVGAGNMGGAIAQALLEKNFCTPESLCIADPSPEKLKIFEAKGCPTSCNAQDFLPESDIVILATKPQGMKNLLQEFRSFFSSKTCLISLAAGVSLDSLLKSSGVKKRIRVMPNTPALVGMGVSGYLGSDEVLDEEKNFVQKMLNCFGVALACSDEDQINAITALSGSGVAYYFFLLEITVKKAELFGFSAEQAKEIALQTLRGAGELAFSTPDTFAELREKVTSKGGTTESALRDFEKNGLESVWTSGISSAYQRAKELSG